MSETLLYGIPAKIPPGHPLLEQLSPYPSFRNVESIAIHSPLYPFDGEHHKVNMRGKSTVTDMGSVHVQKTLPLIYSVNKFTAGR
jgi:hypothetical protein